MCSDVVHGSLVLCSAHICCYYKMCRPFCINFNFLFLLACDDECVGVLLSDLDNIGEATLPVNVTSIIPVPYGILSNLENTTRYLWVCTGNIEMGRNTEIQNWSDSRSHSGYLPHQCKCLIPNVQRSLECDQNFTIPMLPYFPVGKL